MMSMRDFYVLLFVVVVIAFVASLVVLLVVKSSNKWKYWGLGFGIYVVLSAWILGPIHSSIQSNEDEKYKFRQLKSKAEKDPNCKTERDVCMQHAISMKRSNDINLRSNLQSLEETLKQDPTNREIQTNVQRMQATLAADVQRIDDCKHKPTANSCTKELLDTCQHMILSNQPADVFHQFVEFRKTKEPSEVLNFCNGIAS